jgi:CHAT domain-containing protein/tetratricopeptide (TPR) repeat protein
MKARPRNWLSPLLSTGVFLLTGSALTQPQQPAQQPSTTPTPAQTQPAPSTDLAAQEDELIKRCNEQMNVKGEFKEAEKLAKQALELSEKMGDKKRTMVALMYLGSAYAYEGNQLEALEIFKRTADLAREIDNRKGLSRALNNISGVLGNLGRYEESLSYMYQCMDVARELGDLPMQYTVLTNIGRLYMATGEPDKAEAPLLESLRIGRDLKHSDLVSNPSKVATEMSLMFLGGMEAEREHYQVALKYFDQVRESRPDSAQTQVELLNSIAFAHQRLGEYQKAAEVLQESIPIAEKAHTADLATVLSNLGEAQESLGQLEGALGTENRALSTFRGFGTNTGQEWQIERRIGHIDHALSRNEEALSHYENSLHALEYLRTVALNTEAGRAGFAALSRAVYAETCDLLVDLHRESEALEVAERGRARAFLDMLALSRTGLADELTPEQRKREDGILAHISAVQKNLWKENIPTDEEKKLKAELTSAEDDLETFHVEVRHSNPRYASIEYPEPVNVSNVQKDLLDAQTVLVEFLLGEKRSLVWVASKDKLTVGVLPPRKEIEDEVSAYRKSLTGRISALTLAGSLAEIEPAGKKLYSSLLQPVENALVGARTLVIVSDGALGYLPFETLILPAPRSASGEARPSYLLEKFAIVYGPSASALLTVKGMNREQAKPPKTILAFGDPIVDAPPLPAKNGAEATRSASPQPVSKPDATVADEYAERGFSFSRLPYTRSEVLGISNLYAANQRQVYLGEQAREETVKTEKLQDYRYIHFASHGFIDETQPSRSGILFSRDSHSTDDGVLQMGEIMRLKMNADLVTLSACSTGLGKLVNGEGILGLTRAFFYAGARNVTVSLWNVNDSATATLMKAYYQSLNRGLPNSAALRQAKLALLRGSNPSWRHPYFWAPFVLIGEGK